MSAPVHKFIITKQAVGRREAPTDWLICWDYKSAIKQAHYRTKLDCGESIVWGVRVVRATEGREYTRQQWLKDNPNATSNQIYNFAPPSTW